jgi:quinol monooxygenase YgiN
MTVPADDNRDLLTVVATITAKPGNEQQVKDLLSSFIEPSRADRGNVAYTLHQGADDPATFVFYEVWESKELLGEHLASPVLQEGLAALGPLVAGPPVIVPLNRIA